MFPVRGDVSVWAREGINKEKDIFLFIYFWKFRMKSSSVERHEFSGVAWRLTGIQHSGWGWEDHSTSQERWTRMFWKVILSLEASLTSRSQTSGGDVDCDQWVEVGGCWACGCFICKHHCLELDVSCNR